MKKSTRKPSYRTLRPAQGLTLIELLATLTIFIFLIGAGVPTLNHWTQRSAESTAFETLFHLIVFARTEAIKSNDYFTVCPSENHRACGGSWNKDIIVFKDSNKNEVVDANETLFKSISMSDSTPCITWNLKKRQYLQFKPSGAINGTAGHFRFCDNVESVTNKKLVLSFNGRTSLRPI